ncbi:DUF3795 domain-containing protein [Chloroflexota bacterium]
MTDLRYDTYCGLYCGACEIMAANTDEDKNRIINMWSSETWEATPEQLSCRGCKTDHPFIYCANCAMRQCARSKGVEVCIQCGEFPCVYYEQGRTAVEQIPNLKHMKAIIKNLRQIRDHGVEHWLANEKSKWECPQCKAPFTWYMEECRFCVKDLRGMKDYETLTEEDVTF